MSEYREHNPLLHDELSEEDQSIPRHYRRRSFSNRNRIKVNLKGAAAIIKHWPGNLINYHTYLSKLFKMLYYEMRMFKV